MILTNLKKYISTHQIFVKIYIRKIIKCFTNYKPIKIIPNLLNGKDIDSGIGEIVYGKAFQ